MEEYWEGIRWKHSRRTFEIKYLKSIGKYWDEIWLYSTCSTRFSMWEKHNEFKDMQDCLVQILQDF